MRRDARWPVVLLLPACLLAVFLCMAAWRLVDQEETAERQRLRERLENAASLVVRESERALAQAAADGQASLSVSWDERGLRRVSGKPLLWSPVPEPLDETSPSLFSKGEDLEFAKAQPERAITEYSALLRSHSSTVRAGALVRIARCQRRMGRAADACENYQRLKELGTVPVAGSPAALVGLKERAALFESAGNSAAAAKERQQMRAVLETGSHSIDRASFEFFAEGVPIDPEALVWPEGVEQLWKLAEDSVRGVTILRVKDRCFAAEWVREGRAGTGRLVDLRAVDERLANALKSSSAFWQLTDAGGARLAGSDPAGPTLVRKPAESGLPWGVKVAVPPNGARTYSVVFAGGLLLLGLAIIATLYLAYRAVRRELHVAKMQSEFVAAVSHEFRTPITALTHLADLLESGDAAEERKPLYFQALARETRRLREMVENLLDFGRIEAGRYLYRAEDVELTGFVREVLEEFAAQPAAEGRELLFDDAAGERRLTVDREALRRALWNLLDNAAKYSPAGSRLTIGLNQENGWMRLSVLDRGPGIEPEERKRIFQKFVRGRVAEEEHVKGTGIGLAMVDAIARAHGGRVELDSAAGMGSQFTICLPCAGRR